MWNPAGSRLLLFFLLLLILLIKLYFLVDFPALADEVYSYLYFIHPGPLGALTDYREPNNHLFYSLFNSLLYPIKGILVMRLISLISYLLLLFYLYKFIKTEFGALSALLSLCFHGFLLSTGEFSILGRGYAFMALFGNISIICCYQYFTENQRNSRLYMFTIFNILGLFTIPSYVIIASSLYAYGICQLLINKFSKRVIVSFLASILISSIIVSLLYLPLIIHSGYHSLVNNSWVSPLKISQLISIFPVCIIETGSYLTGIEHKSYLVLILWFISIALLFIKKWEHPKFRQWLFLCTFLIIVPIIVILVIRRYPPYRTFYYLSFILFITFSITLVSFIEQLKNLILKNVVTIAIIIASISIGTIQFYKSSQGDLVYGISRSYYEKIEEQQRLIFSNNIKSIYVDTKDEYLDLYLKYALLKRDSIVLSNTPDQEFELLILYKNDFPSTIDRTKYEVINQTSEVRIYKKIKP